MKKTTLLSAMLVAGLTVLPAGSWAQTFEDVTSVVRMTTAKAVGEEISVSLNPGSFLIDWGNGEVKQVESTGEAIKGTVQGTELVIGSNDFRDLDCSSCGLTKLELAASDLKSLDCSYNQLSEIYIQAMSWLETLDCSDNVLTTLYFSSTSKTNLKSLDCSNNQLSSLSVSGCEKLEYLQCSQNLLTSLSLSGLTSLTTLWCYSNSLTTLNLSVCSNLQSVVCSDNQLTELTPSNSAAKIVDFWCNDNSLTSLSLLGSVNLQTVSCANNQLETVTLPAVSTTNGLLAVYLQNNKLLFSDFYATSSVNDYVYGPQRVFSLPKNEININESIDLPECDKNVDGQTINPEVRWVNSLTAEDLEYGRNADYTYRSSTYTFLKPFESIYCIMSTSLYPGLELFSEQLKVVDPSTGVEKLNAENGFVCYGHAGQLVMSAQKTCAVKVYAADGKNVWTGKVGNTPVTVSLPTGIYVVNGVKVSL